MNVWTVCAQPDGSTSSLLQCVGSSPYVLVVSNCMLKGPEPWGPEDWGSKGPLIERSTTCSFLALCHKSFYFIVANFSFVIRAIWWLALWIVIHSPPWARVFIRSGRTIRFVVICRKGNFERTIVTRFTLQWLPKNIAWIWREFNPRSVSNGNGLLFHTTQPTSRSTIKAIAYSKPTISEN